MVDGKNSRISQVFELLTGDALFDRAFQTVELGITPEESHLIQMIEIFGKISPDIIRAGKFSDQWFTKDGEFYIERKIAKTQLLL